MPMRASCSLQSFVCKQSRRTFGHDHVTRHEGERLELLTEIHLRTVVQRDKERHAPYKIAVSDDDPRV